MRQRHRADARAVGVTEIDHHRPPGEIRLGHGAPGLVGQREAGRDLDREGQGRASLMGRRVRRGRVGRAVMGRRRLGEAHSEDERQPETHQKFSSMYF